MAAKLTRRSHNVSDNLTGNHSKRHSFGAASILSLVIFWAAQIRLFCHAEVCCALPVDIRAAHFRILRQRRTSLRPRPSRRAPRIQAYAWRSPGYLGADPVTVGLYVSAGPTVEGVSPAGETARCRRPGQRVAGCRPLRAGPAAESKGEHCGGDLAGRGVPQGGTHVVEDEQPRGGDRVGERLAVADREEWVRAAVHDERRQRELAEALTPPRDLLLRRHFRSVPGRCWAWPGVPPSCSDNG